LKIFGEKEIGKKAACKMLVILSTERMSVLQKNNVWSSVAKKRVAHQ